MEYRLCVGDRWKDDNEISSRTYNAFKLVEYDWDEFEDLIDVFLENKDFNYVINSSSLIDKVDEGTVVVFKDNVDDVYYFGVVDSIDGYVVNIDIICLFESFYGFSDVEIDYFKKRDVSVDVDCSSVVAKACLYKGGECSLGTDFYVGVLADEILCEVFDCKEEYILSLI
jgi:hypothetical protein